MSRVAVVLFNLGGPDSQADVRPFLENLFSDPAIIGLPGFLRRPLARLIARRRETSAQANYALMGGGSPLLGETWKQAGALQAALDSGPDETRVFVAMRYWRPLIDQTAAEVAAWLPDRIVLLPLYPQFSTTTTGSSLEAWTRSYDGPGEIHAVCCYPQDEAWVEAQARLITAALTRAEGVPIRVLFSAHGVPERVIRRRGDPYQAQIEAGCAAVAERAGLSDWTICYQSRVGPMKWLGPSTPAALEKAARDGVGAVVVPIAFVSEHIETLVELDIEYAELAHRLGVSPYLRVPALGTTPGFIGGLASAARAAIRRSGVAPCGAGCRQAFKACPHQAERRAA